MWVHDTIVQKENMNDQKLHRMIFMCAQQGWLEELRLAIDIPRSSVESL